MTGQLAMFTPPEMGGLAGILERAAEEWGLNCGPGAICGALAICPDAVRPHLGDFEQRGYMNPRQMWAALRSLGVDFDLDASGAAGCRITRPAAASWPVSNGIVRLQWGGPWCDEGRPVAAAYRYTHWVAGRRDVLSGEVWVFDVNNLAGGGVVCESGWLPLYTWRTGVLPVLLPARGDGRWWITHTAELLRGAS